MAVARRLQWRVFVTTLPFQSGRWSREMLRREAGRRQEACGPERQKVTLIASPRPIQRAAWGVTAKTVTDGTLFAAGRACAGRHGARAVDPAVSIRCRALPQSTSPGPASSLPRPAARLQ